jgi:NADH-quinone oxidoreductase subunit I
MSILETLARVARRLFAPSAVKGYPETPPPLPPRSRGRIILTRDPSGEERCVACDLCAVVCPVDCIDLQKAPDGWYPERFRIDFSRCIFCGLCEEACPTLAIQLTPDFEMSAETRRALVQEKADLLVDHGGKHPDHDFRRLSGADPAAEGDAPPVDLRELGP